MAARSADVTYRSGSHSANCDMAGEACAAWRPADYDSRRANDIGEAGASGVQDLLQSPLGPTREKGPAYCFADNKNVDKLGSK